MSDSRQARCFEESHLLLNVHRLNEVVMKIQNNGGDLKKSDLFELKNVFEHLKSDISIKKNVLSNEYKKFCIKHNVSENISRSQPIQFQQPVPLMQTTAIHQPKKVLQRPLKPEPIQTPIKIEKKEYLKEQPVYHGNFNTSLPIVDKIIKRSELDSNEKDIWFDTSRFFEELPSRCDVERILDSSFPLEVSYLPQQKVHWSEKFKILIQNSQLKGKRLLEPPGPPPPESEISDFWKKNTPPFQIEEEMLKNVSPAHRILSCLVISPPILKINSNKSKKFMKTNYLAPKIPYDPYLGLSFEEKLNLELISLGLVNPHGYTISPDDGPFAQEISKYKEDLNATLPKLNKIREEILSNLESYRMKEQKRKRETQAFMDLYVDENA